MSAKIRILVFAVILVVACGCSKNGEVLQHFSFVAEANQSVFEQTRRHFAVQYDSSAMGIFVKAIDGIANTKAAYWLYFVNSSPAKQAADRFVPAGGDTIEWRLISGY